MTPLAGGHETRWRGSLRQRHWPGPCSAWAANCGCAWSESIPGWSHANLLIPGRKSEVRGPVKAEVEAATQMLTPRQEGTAVGNPLFVWLTFLPETDASSIQYHAVFLAAYIQYPGGAFCVDSRTRSSILPGIALHLQPSCHPSPVYWPRIVMKSTYCSGADHRLHFYVRGRAVCRTNWPVVAIRHAVSQSFPLLSLLEILCATSPVTKTPKIKYKHFINAFLKQGCDVILRQLIFTQTEFQELASRQKKRSQGLC